MARGFNLTAQLNLRGPSNLRPVISQIRRQLGNISVTINPVVDPAAARNVTALQNSLNGLNRVLGQTNILAGNTARSITNLSNAAAGVGANLRGLPNNINAATGALNRAVNAAQATRNNVQQAADGFEAFGQQSALAVRRFAAFATVTGIIYKFTNALSTATSQFIDFNQELIRVSQVTDKSLKELSPLVGQITALSTGLGVASKDLITVSSTLAQAGLSARDTEKALKALALSSLAPSFDSLNDTVEGSIALMRQFDISAGDLEGALGSVNAVAAAFAVESADLITAIQRTGGVFAAASKGVSEGKDALNEFLAIFTSVRQTTRESAETIATGLRTIFTRIQRGKTIDALKEYGVVLTDLSGKFVGPYEAVKRLSEGLSSLDPRDLRFSQIVEELGGFRQIGKVIPLIQQFAVAQQALKVAQEGQGSLATDAATAQLSLANRLTKVREEFNALIRSVGESSSFQTFVKLSLDLASALIRLADSAKNVLPALTAIAAFRGVSALSSFARGFSGRAAAPRVATPNSGGYIRGFATGGIVPGSGNRDTVPAMLTPGEFVMNKAAVQKYGAGNLVKMNQSGRADAAADPRKTLEKYYGDSSSINLGLAQSKKLSKSERQGLASDVKDLRKLRSPAPEKLYSSISRVAFDTMASQTGFNKNVPMPEGTKYFDKEKVYSAEAQKMAGKSFSLPGFVSTSKDFSKAKLFLDNAPRAQDEWAAMLSIITKQNAQGIDVAQQLKGRNVNFTKRDINPRTGKMETMYMNSPESEQEVMLPPRSRFKILKAMAVQLGERKNIWADVQQYANGGNVKDFGPLVYGFQDRGGVTPQQAQTQAKVKDKAKSAPESKKRAGRPSKDSNKGDILEVGSASTPPMIDVLFSKVGKNPPTKNYSETILNPNNTNDKKLIETYKQKGMDIGLVKYYFGAHTLDQEASDSFVNNLSPMIEASVASLAGTVGSIKGLSPSPLPPVDPNAVRNTVKSRLDPEVVDSISGYFFEGIINSLTGAPLTDSRATWDFLNPDATTRQKLNTLFGQGKSDQANIAGNFLEAKATADAGIITDSSKGNSVRNKVITSLADNIITPNFIKNSKTEAKKRMGGQIRRFATGGLVPGVGNTDSVPMQLPVGSFVIRKSSVNKIGADNLASMAGYATGGNVKTVDALVTPGEWIFSPDQASKIGSGTLNSMNKFGKFAKGGSVGPQRFFDGGDIDRIATGLTPKDAAQLRQAAQKNIQAFENLFNNLNGLPTEEIASGMKSLARAVNRGATDIDQEVRNITLGQKGTRASGGATRQAPKPRGEEREIQALAAGQETRTATRDPVTGQYTRPVGAAQTFTQVRGLRGEDITQKATGSATGGQLQKSYMDKLTKEAGQQIASMGLGARDTKQTLLVFRTQLKATGDAQAALTAATQTATRLQSTQFTRPDVLPQKTRTERLIDYSKSKTAVAEGYQRTASDLRSRASTQTGFQSLGTNIKADISSGMAAFNKALAAGATTLSTFTSKTGGAISSVIGFGRQLQSNPLSTLMKAAGNAANSLYSLGKSAIGGGISKVGGGVLGMLGLGKGRGATAGAAAAGGGMGGGMMAMMLPMVGGMVVDSVSKSMGGETTDIGRKVGSMGGQALNYGSMGAMVGSMVAPLLGPLAPLGPALGGLLGGVAGLTMGFFEAEKAGKEYAQTQKQAAADLAMEKSGAAIEKFAQSGNARDRAAAMEAFKASSEKEAAVGAGVERTQAGYFTNAESMTDFAQRKAKTQKAGADQAEKLLSAAMMKSGKTFEEMSKSMDPAEFKMLAQNIAEADKSYAYFQAQRANEISRLKSEGRGAEAAALEARTITDQETLAKNIAQRQMKEHDAAVAAQKAAAASKALAATVDRAILNLERTFEIMNQSMQRTSFEFEQAGARIQEITSGQVNLASGQDLSRQMNVLENPEAYGAAERNQALASSAAIIGPQGAMTARISQFGPNARNEAMRIGNRAASTGATNEDIGIDIKDTLRRQIEAAYGADTDIGRNAVRKMMDSVDKAIKETPPGEPVDVNAVVDAAVGPLMKASEQASKTLIEANKMAANALGKLAEVSQAVADAQQTQIDRTNALRDMQRESSLKTQEALGMKVNGQDRIRSRMAGTAQRLGFARPQDVNASNIAAARQNAMAEQNRLKAQQPAMEQAAVTGGPAAAKNLVNFNTRLAQANQTVKNLDKELENLPQLLESNLNDVLSEIQDRVNDLESRKQAGAAFAEKLVGSTPQELQEISRAYNLLENTLRGNIITINRSQSAQAAYANAIQQGKTMQEAYTDAQSAFANDTKSALGLFNELTQMTGVKGESFDKMRADLLENFARAQGMGLQNNPLFQKVISELRASPQQRAQNDPVIATLMNQAEAIKKAQVDAVTEQNKIDREKQKELLEGVAGKIIEDLKAARVNISVAVEGGARAIGAEVVRPRSRGGIIYASKGKLINYEPKGTDTVPAMLTPGEFVINRSATQKNLPLLQAINSGAMSKGGVVYLASGGSSKQDLSGSASRSNMAFNMENAQKQNSILKMLDSDINNVKFTTNDISRDTGTIKDTSIPGLSQQGSEGLAASSNGLKSLGTAIAQLSKELSPAKKPLSDYYNKFNSFSGRAASTLASISDNADFLMPAVTTISDQIEQLARAVKIRNIIQGLGNQLRAAFANIGPALQQALQNGIGNVGNMLGFSSGGPVYANTGKLINFQPRGTDTVPAMLTPGEFVVNRAATQKNLSLLQSINSGATGYSSGGVVYAQDGKEIKDPQKYKIAGRDDTFTMSHLEDMPNRKKIGIPNRSISALGPTDIQPTQNMRRQGAAVQLEANIDPMKELAKSYDRHPNEFQDGYYQELFNTIQKNNSADARAQELLDFELLLRERQYNWNSLQLPEGELIPGSLLNANDTKKSQLKEIGELLPQVGKILDEINKAKQPQSFAAGGLTIPELRLLSSVDNYQRNKYKQGLTADTWVLAQKQLNNNGGLYTFLDANRRPIVGRDPTKPVRTADGETSESPFWTWKSAARVMAPNKQLALQAMLNLLGVAGLASDEQLLSGDQIFRGFNFQSNTRSSPADKILEEIINQRGIDKITKFGPFNSPSGAPDGQKLPQGTRDPQGNLPVWDAARALPLVDPAGRAAQIADHIAKFLTIKDTDISMEKIVDSMSKRYAALREARTNITSGKSILSKFKLKLYDENLKPKYVQFLTDWDIASEKEQSYLLGVYRNLQRFIAGPATPINQSSGFSLSNFPASDSAFDPVNFNTGGVVYANNGMLIPYQPKGTDTVPAMLTPGEFVVNRDATQKHLPLLKSINSGVSNYSSGGVVYAANGGWAENKQGFTPEQIARREKIARRTQLNTSYNDSVDRAFKASTNKNRNDILDYEGTGRASAGVGTMSRGTYLFNTYGALDWNDPKQMAIYNRLSPKDKSVWESAELQSDMKQLGVSSSASARTGVDVGFGLSSEKLTAFNNDIDKKWDAKVQASIDKSRAMEAQNKKERLAEEDDTSGQLHRDNFIYTWHKLNGIEQDDETRKTPDYIYNQAKKYGTDPYNDPSLPMYNAGAFGGRSNPYSNRPDLTEPLYAVNRSEAYLTELEYIKQQQEQSIEDRKKRNENYGASGRDIVENYRQQQSLINKEYGYDESFANRFRTKSKTPDRLRAGVITNAYVVRKQLEKQLRQAFAQESPDFLAMVGAGNSYSQADIITLALNKVFSDPMRVRRATKQDLENEVNLEIHKYLKEKQRNIAFRQNIARPNISERFAGAGNVGEIPNAGGPQGFGQIIGSAFTNMFSPADAAKQRRSYKKNPQRTFSGNGRNAIDNSFARNFYSGGIAYANTGMLIPYQPKGTDTIPAMLTPGEFVVNRQSAKQNLPLLQSINSGQYSNGGKISYLAEGTQGVDAFNKQMMLLTEILRVSGDSIQSGLSSLVDKINKINLTSPEQLLQNNSGVSNTSDSNPLAAIQALGNKLDQFIVQLQQSIPPSITLEVPQAIPVNVNINGAAALQNLLNGPLSSMIQGIISEALNDQSRKREGQ